MKVLSPKQSLNKAYQKESISRNDIERFKINLSLLFENIDTEESEENVKNHLSNFLRNTFYKDKYLINTKGRIDLAVYLDNKQQSKTGIIAEAKRPKNKNEMITKDNLNCKAMWEIILNYVEERIDGKNHEIKYLVITNIYEWFIFDAVIFENLFYNKNFIKKYNTWKNKQNVSESTELFYKEVAKPEIEKIKDEITFTYFNFNDYKKYLSDKRNDSALIPVYKILSPEHLLKQPFANDSNNLDKNFYNELLHIIGLEEIKQGNKKLINRKSIEKRESGSLIENTIQSIETDNRLSFLSQVEKYGSTKEERLFNAALELCITWINRILFLKLLEAQLYKYHHKDEKYKFLNSNVIFDFDELHKLFHRVLAIPVSKRDNGIIKKFQLIPYLNSSLFEQTNLENETIRINSLDDKCGIKLSNNTVLKDNTGKRRSGTLPVLQYLFEFLDAYNFTSEGKAEITEDNKTLINASVLGLIFEKINGYKDGSYFTPGFITMYMCRETIRRAAIQKFNEKYDWKCETFDDLKNHIASKRNTNDVLEFNKVINSLKICDPAVGSGHFLVSALNEIITIKSELGIIADKNGVILKDYNICLGNDELTVTNVIDEDIFEYHPPKSKSNEVQKVQEILFNEKQTIIENCLFGVDINPNSVKIAQLRLWIELLKNAYYKEESSFTELETLPNIDINIKEGNSLVSRFPIDADLKTALKTIRYTIDDYKNFVYGYKNTDNKEEKSNYKRFIDEIKNIFKTSISNNDPKVIRLNKLAYELHTKFKEDRLFSFELSDKEKDKLKKEEKRLEEQIKNLSKEIEDIKNSEVYRNAFEWRFEFPEVLDNEGKFVGFDVVIGNPPYIGFQELSMKEYYNPNYFTAKGKYDIYVLFIELMKRIASLKAINSFILPHKYLVADFGSNTRDFLAKNKFVNRIIYFDEEMVFEDVTTYTCITLFSNYNKYLSFIKCKPSDLVFIDKDAYKKILYDNLNENSWILIEDKKSKIIEKVKSVGNKISSIFDGILQGIVSGDNEAFYLYDCEDLNNGVIKGYSKILYKKIEIEKGLCKPLLSGKNLNKWTINFDNTFIIYTYFLIKGKTILISETDLKSNYPKTYEYFTSIKARLDSRGSDKMKYSNWFALWNPRKINNLQSKKILTPDICLGTKMSYDSIGDFYYNDTGYALVKKESVNIPYEYFLGILNSKLIWFFLSQTGNILRGGYFRFKTKYLEPISLPIASEEILQEIFDLVGQIIKLKEKNFNNNTINLESRIDQIVYQLYGLTEEEIKMVEGSLNTKKT